MPEKMTKEDRIISMAIEKAKEVKEAFRLNSLEDNNRQEHEDESEHVKVKRPKAENAKIKGKYKGKHSGFGLDSYSTAGDSHKY